MLEDLEWDVEPPRGEDADIVAACVIPVADKRLAFDERLLRIEFGWRIDHDAYQLLGRHGQGDPPEGEPIVKRPHVLLEGVEPAQNFRWAIDRGVVNDGVVAVTLLACFHSAAETVFPKLASDSPSHGLSSAALTAA